MLMIDVCAAAETLASKHALSSWPESLYTYEQMWSRLAEDAHPVAIDLPGFGPSERCRDRQRHRGSAHADRVCFS